MPNTPIKYNANVNIIVIIEAIAIYLMDNFSSVTTVNIGTFTFLYSSLKYNAKLHICAGIQMITSADISNAVNQDVSGVVIAE